MLNDPGTENKILNTDLGVLRLMYFEYFSSTLIIFKHCFFKVFIIPTVFLQQKPINKKFLIFDLPFT